MTRIRVLSPVGVATRDMVTVPPLPESLVGRTVGFLDNRKANFDRLADEIGGILCAEHGVKTVGVWGIQDWPRWMHAVTDDDALPPQVTSPEDVIVMVAGGPGKHSAVVPNCTFSRAVSRPIQPI